MNPCTYYTYIVYLIIRCPGCLSFTYVDKYQKWKLCPICSETISPSKVQVYLDVETPGEAEIIARQLQKYLKDKRKKDLDEDEIQQIREEYAGWVRSHPPV